MSMKMMSATYLVDNAALLSLQDVYKRQELQSQNERMFLLTFMVMNTGCLLYTSQFCRIRFVTKVRSVIYE